MPIIDLLIVIIVVGLLLYLANLIPMDSRIKQVLNIVVVVLLVLWILGLLVPGIGLIRVGPR